jgi:polysaccharide deacetylase 2 family uncharacterized protein YibQ
MCARAEKGMKRNCRMGNNKKNNLQHRKQISVLCMLAACLLLSGMITVYSLRTTYAQNRPLSETDDPCNGIKALVSEAAIHAGVSPHIMGIESLRHKDGNTITHYTVPIEPPLTLEHLAETISAKGNASDFQTRFEVLSDNKLAIQVSAMGTPCLEITCITTEPIPPSFYENTDPILVQEQSPSGDMATTPSDSESQENMPKMPSEDANAAVAQEMSLNSAIEALKQRNKPQASAANDAPVADTPSPQPAIEQANAMQISEPNHLNTDEDAELDADEEALKATIEEPMVGEPEILMEDLYPVVEEPEPVVEEPEPVVEEPEPVVEEPEPVVEEPEPVVEEPEPVVEEPEPVVEEPEPVVEEPEPVVEEPEPVVEEPEPVVEEPEPVVEEPEPVVVEPEPVVVEPEPVVVEPEPVVVEPEPVVVEPEPVVVEPEPVVVEPEPVVVEPEPVVVEPEPVVVEPEPVVVEPEPVVVEPEPVVVEPEPVVVEPEPVVVEPEPVVVEPEPVVVEPEPVVVEPEPVVVEPEPVGVEPEPAKDLRPGKIALILDDGGYGGAVTPRVLQLDNHITLAILPDTPFAESTAKEALAKGFEIMLHMPMQSSATSRVHAFPGELTLCMTKEEIQKRTRECLDQFPDAVGVNNHTGAGFTVDEERVGWFLEVVKEYDIFFVDSRTTWESCACDLAIKMKVPAARRTIFLDNSSNQAEIRKYLNELITRARAQGTAVGIGHFRPNTITVLEEELPKLKDLKIELIRVSEIVR